MPRIAVLVEFTLEPANHAAFSPIIREHARATLEEEEGCLLFEVLQPLRDGAPDPTRMMVFEIYADQAAFEAHGRNPRLPRVREAYAPLIEGRKMTLSEL